MTNFVTNPGSGGATFASDTIAGVEYPLAKSAWGTAGTATQTDATNPLPTSTNASIFRFSTNNSSTVQLAANATFTGVIETALDQPSISILMTSDQPMTVTVQQFIDSGGTYAATPLYYYARAGAGLAVSVPLNGNYVRVTAQNTGTATTTTFNLNTAYGTIPMVDGEGRTPVSFDDCQPLLTATITGTGTSSVIDTIGYSAVVTQLTGVWQGNLTFEGSNDGVNWDGLMIHSRDNPALQDSVSQTGLYTVRPAGRYMRLNVTSITGTLGVNAIGRSGTGIDAGDYLSLAMDKANNAPLFTELNDSTVSKLQTQPMQIIGQFSQNGVIQINSVLMQIDCSLYRTLYIQCISMGTAGIILYEWSNDGNTWASTYNAINSSSVTNALSGAALVKTACHAKYFRMRLTTATTAGTTTLVIAGSQTVEVSVVQAVGSVAVTGYPTAAASADALTNPTITQIGADGMQFNGTSWDRERNNWNTTTGDTGAKTASFAGATQTNFNSAGATILINMGTVSGTTPTLTAQVQGSADSGTTWYNIAGAVTPTINATGTTTLVVYPGVAAVANAAVSSVIPRTWRLNYTIGGTTPSFTITNVQVAYNC